MLPQDYRIDHDANRAVYDPVSSSSRPVGMMNRHFKDDDKAGIVVIDKFVMDALNKADQVWFTGPRNVAVHGANLGRPNNIPLKPYVQGSSASMIPNASYVGGGIIASILYAVSEYLKDKARSEEQTTHYAMNQLQQLLVNRTNKDQEDTQFVTQMRRFIQLYFMMLQLNKEGVIREPVGKEEIARWEDPSDMGEFYYIQDRLAKQLGFDRTEFVAIYNQLFGSTTPASNLYFTPTSTGTIELVVEKKSIVPRARPRIPADEPLTFSSAFTALDNSKIMRIGGALLNAGMQHSMYYWIGWFAMSFVAGIVFGAASGATFGLAFAIPAVISLVMLGYNAYKSREAALAQKNETWSQKNEKEQYAQNKRQNFQFMRALFAHTHHARTVPVGGLGVPQPVAQKGLLSQLFSTVAKSRALQYCSTFLTGLVGGFVGVLFPAWPLTDFLSGFGATFVVHTPFLVTVAVLGLVVGVYSAIKNVISLKKAFHDTDKVKSDKPDVFADIETLKASIARYKQNHPDAAARLSRHDLRTLTAPTLAGRAKSFFKKAFDRLREVCNGTGTGFLIPRLIIGGGTVLGAILAPHAFFIAGVFAGAAYCLVKLFDYCKRKAREKESYTLENIETKRSSLIAEAKALGIDVKQLNLNVDKASARQSTAAAKKRMDSFLFPAAPSRKSGLDLSDEAHDKRLPPASAPDQSPVREKSPALDMFAPRRTQRKKQKQRKERKIPSFFIRGGCGDELSRSADRDAIRRPFRGEAMVS